jgi:hypothetical protein
MSAIVRYARLVTYLIAGAMAVCFATFRINAIEDPSDHRKYGFGSIREVFFRKSKDNEAEKRPAVQQDNALSKKDKAWRATMATLLAQELPIAYANKETGVIKTEETHTQAFDASGKILYQIVIHVSENGILSVCVKSPSDSKKNLKRHGEQFEKLILASLQEQ